VGSEGFWTERVRDRAGWARHRSALQQALRRCLQRRRAGQTWVKPPVLVSYVIITRHAVATARPRSVLLIHELVRSGLPSDLPAETYVCPSQFRGRTTKDAVLMHFIHYRSFLHNHQHIRVQPFAQPFVLLISSTHRRSSSNSGQHLHDYRLRLHYAAPGSLTAPHAPVAAACCGAPASMCSAQNAAASPRRHSDTPASMCSAQNAAVALCRQAGQGGAPASMCSAQNAAEPLCRRQGFTPASMCSAQNAAVPLCRGAGQGNAPASMCSAQNAAVRLCRRQGCTPASMCSAQNAAVPLCRGAGLGNAPASMCSAQNAAARPTGARGSLLGAGATKGGPAA
jgi:hypothetical protein